MALGNKKKLAIIIIAIIVAVPSIGFGVYYGINKTGNNIIDNTTISISSVQILSADNKGMNLSIQGIIDNPSSLSANMGDLNLSVNYNSVEIGTTQVNAMSFSAGNNSIDQHVFMTVTNQSEFSTFLSDFVKSANVTVSINGTASISASGIKLSKDITKDISLNGLNNKLAVNLQDFGIVNASGDSFYANITTQIQNPSSISMSLKNVNFAIYTNNTLMGNLTIPTLKIENGTTSSNRIVLVHLSNLALFNDTANQLLSDNNVNIKLKGISSTENILSPVFSALNLNFTLQGLPPANVVILNMAITNSTANSIGFNLTLQVTNPTLSPISTHDLQFNVTYNRQQVGIVIINSLNIQTGTRQYVIPSTMTFTNQTLLSDLLTAYLNGQQIVFNVKGSSNGGNIIENIVANYIQNISLPLFGNLNYQLMGVSLSGATYNTLILDTQIKIQNPAPVTVTVSNLLLNVTYQQSWIGNLTLTNTDVTTGNNTIDATITISGDKNMTAVESFIEAYIEGGTIPLSLNGSIAVKLAGMQETMNSTLNFEKDLPGATQSLISSVLVNLITVQYNPTPQMSANVNATIDNPFNFGINITSVTYDVYFNDPYGYNFVVTSGSPKNNIDIDSVSSDFSSNPLQLTASSSTSTSASISNTNLDTCSRLYSDYTIHNNLVVNLKNGVMNIAIGEFTATVGFNISGISVS